MSENLISQTTPETPATTSEESIIDQWCDLKEERASAHISKEEAEIIIKKEVEARVAEIEDGYLEQIAGLKRELEALNKEIKHTVNYIFCKICCELHFEFHSFFITLLSQYGLSFLPLELKSGM